MTEVKELVNKFWNDVSIIDDYLKEYVNLTKEYKEDRQDLETAIITFRNVFISAGLVMTHNVLVEKGIKRYFRTLL